MSDSLTLQQARTKAFIADYLARHNGASPSYDEIAAAIGQRSKSGVHRIVHGLVRRGHLMPLVRGHYRQLKLARQNCPHCAGDLNASAAP